MEATNEVQELSLVKVIETKLVQNNVTEQLLEALKKSYGGMKLKSLEDKESYLELKSAAKDCAKVRTLTVKVCKEGREEAVKVQKAWVAEEKRVVARITEVEAPLDAEIALYDAEIDRKATEEKNKQEEAYINRQATLTKMGAVYSGGSFVLGEASFEAELIKSSSEDIWNDAIVPNFKEEYEKIEAVRIEEQKVKHEAEVEFKLKQAELLKQQQALKDAQAEMDKQKEAAERKEREKAHIEQLEKDRIQHEIQTKRFNKMFPFNLYGTDMDMNNLWALSENDFEEKLEAKKNESQKVLAEKESQAESKRLKDIEDAKALAIQQEKERVAALEAKRIADLEASKDKDKWEAFISEVKKIETFEMRSGQYRKKMQMAKEKIEEIINL